jgi:hypothetical protein
MSLIDDLKAEVGAIEKEAEAVGALLWKDLKGAAQASGTVLDQAIKAEMPAFITYLEGYAKLVVQDVQANPAFLGAIGSWKLGIASNMLFQEVKKGFPGFEKFAMGLGQATVETLIQAAVSRLLTGLV